MAQVAKTVRAARTVSKAPPRDYVQEVTARRVSPEELQSFKSQILKKTASKKGDDYISYLQSLQSRLSSSGLREASDSMKAFTVAVASLQKRLQAASPKPLRFPKWMRASSSEVEALATKTEGQLREVTPQLSPDKLINEYLEKTAPIFYSLWDDAAAMKVRRAEVTKQIDDLRKQVDSVYDETVESAMEKMTPEQIQEIKEGWDRNRFDTRVPGLEGDPEHDRLHNPIHAH